MLQTILAITEIHLTITAAACLLIGAVATWIITNTLSKTRLQNAEMQIKSKIQDAEQKSENILKTAQLDAKTQSLKLREDAEKEFEKTRNELRETEKQLTKKETYLDRQTESYNDKKKHIDKLQNKLSQKEQDLANKDSQLTQTLAEQRSILLKTSNLSEEKAKEMILEKLEDDVTHEASALIEKIVTKAKEEAEKRSREIVIDAIQRFAAAQTCECTVSTIDIPSDDMKGRVIGREGRNIRAFEKVTGVDVIIDDTPGVIIISAFDPVRREVAKLSMEKLIKDGRIHPTRIEEIVEETIKETEQKIIEIGKKVLLETNITGVSNKIIPFLGKLSYRTSYGQNILRHSVEVAYLCQVMADELGLNGALARRCGLLHDIGKAADHEEEGGHPAIGAAIGKRANEPAEVINAIEGHHGDVPSISPYTALVAAADAMSASRPGARRETMERYIKRMEALEELARSFKGTKQAYAIQAGREIRVIVDPEEIDDAVAWKTARDIAKKIEEELTYPGEVKVTLLREVRCIEFAR